MELKVIRKYRKPTYTIGKLFLNGEYFCDTLEDTDRNLDCLMTTEKIAEKKVFGQTAIPTGTYNVSLTLSTRFRKVLPLIENVKGFEGVRIHSGNTNKDTLGCILVGRNKVVGGLIDSRPKMADLMNILNACAKRKEKIRLVIC